MAAEKKALPPITCRECGKVFTKEDREKEGRKKYRLMAGGAICTDQPSCRQRTLTVKLGLGLYARRPREVLIALMDIRPPDWKKTGWVPVHSEEERVAAAIEYFSWCYPVGLEFAVQIDAADEPMKDRGQWTPHSHRTLADFLGMKKPNVSRAIWRRERKKLLRQDDGKLYPEPKPPQLTPEERAGISTDSADAILKDLEGIKSVPPKYRAVLLNLLVDAPDGIGTDSWTEVFAACTRFNEELQGIRTSRDLAIEQVCTRAASLLSRQGYISKKPRPATSSSPVESRRQPQSPCPDDDGRAPLKELYEEGYGKGALAKLPSPRPEPKNAAVSTPPASHQEEVQRIAQALTFDHDAAARLLKACRAEDSTISADEVGMLARIKRQQVAKRIENGKIENVPGFLIDAVPKAVTGELRYQATRAIRDRDRRVQSMESKFTEERAERKDDPEVWEFLLVNPEQCRNCAGHGAIDVDGMRVACSCPAGERFRGLTKGAGS